MKGGSVSVGAKSSATIMPQIWRAFLTSNHARCRHKYCDGCKAISLPPRSSDWYICCRCLGENRYDGLTAAPAAGDKLRRLLRYGGRGGVQPVAVKGIVL